MRGLTVGKFDRRITFLKRMEEESEFNSGKITYLPLDANAQCWCNVLPYRNSGESKTADQITEDRTTLFFVRWRTDIDTTMKIDFNGATYDIDSISEPAAYRKQLLQISGVFIPQESWLS